MKETLYAEFVSERFKDPSDITKEFTEHKASVLHATIGICGEAGELLDTVKKYFAYNKDLDLENIVEELGDIEFYLQALRDELQLSREDIINANIEKLSKRYPTAFSNELAQLRLDKNGQ